MMIKDGLDVGYVGDWELATDPRVGGTEGWVDGRLLILLAA